jgi:hypothetical protein
MKIVIIVLLIAVLAAIACLAVVVARWGRRSYQRYSGLERQRASAKQARDAGADRLKDAERHLIEAQQDLAARGEYSRAQDVERLRTRLSTLADRHRYATYGYAPLGSPNPVREAELAQLQQRDADVITDAQAITELAEGVRDRVRDGAVADLRPLEAALERLRAAMDRRKAVN